MPRPNRQVEWDLNDTRSGENIALEQLLRSLEFDSREVIEPLASPDQLKEESETLAGSLRLFIPAAWNLVEPSPFIPNWHIDAIADHLEAVASGDVADLLVTMPPRHSKSLVISVLYPVWEWVNQPFNRWVFASYAFALSVRDSIKRRKILQSKWFRDRWGDRFTMLDEQNTKIRYENDKHGFMLASSVGGSNTGEGGERIVADDPHNVKKAESEEVRNETVLWWDVVMSTRRNVQVGDKRSARIVVQQRVHEGDVAGHIIERGGYVHLNLPTEYMFGGQPGCHTEWVEKATGSVRAWDDPRSEIGELLNPKRFDVAANESAKIELGDYGYASQHGQVPAPPQGTIIQKSWLKFYGGPNQPPIPDWTKCSHPFMPMFSLDSSFKDHKDTDFVAGLAWAMFGADIYLLPNCIHKRLNFPNTIDAIAEFVGGKSLDDKKSWPGIYPFIKIKLIEDKANGSAIIDTLRHKIPGMVPYSPDGASKEARLTACSWRFRAGNVYLPHESIAPWVVEYQYELCAFPKARKDDYVDATSQALLFIGGDAKSSGEVIAEQHTSRWFNMTGMRNEDDEGGYGSIWSGGGNGSIFTGGRSLWRP